MTSECIGGPAAGLRIERPPAKAKDRSVVMVVHGGRYRYDWVTLKYVWMEPSQEEVYRATFFNQG
jgi:hypothetical protein